MLALFKFDRWTKNRLTAKLKSPPSKLCNTVYSAIAPFTALYYALLTLHCYSLQKHGNLILQINTTVKYYIDIFPML